MSILNKRFFSGINITLVLTIYLYCYVSAYQNSYLITLNVTTSILNRNFNEILYDGFLDHIRLYFWLACLSWLFLFFYNCTSQNEKDKLLTLLRKLAQLSVIVFIKDFLIAGKYFFIFIIFFGSIIISESKGKNEALQFKESIGNEQSLDIIVKIGNATKKMALIACGATVCAGALPDENITNDKGKSVVGYTVRYFSHNDFSRPIALTSKK